MLPDQADFSSLPGGVARCGVLMTNATVPRCLFRGKTGGRSATIGKESDQAWRSTGRTQYHALAMNPIGKIRKHGAGDRASQEDPVTEVHDRSNSVAIDFVHAWNRFGFPTVVFRFRNHAITSACGEEVNRSGF